MVHNLQWSNERPTTCEIYAYSDSCQPHPSRKHYSCFFLCDSRTELHEQFESTSFGFASAGSSEMGNSKSKGLGDPQVKTIVERVWNRFCSTSEGYERLGAQDLYCAILLVYNDINKKVPGPYNDPPSKEEVEEILRINDKNEDGYLDRNEFTAFIETFLKDVTAQVGSNVLLFSFVIPTVVSLSRPKLEQLPHVGPIVKKAPPSLYSAILTTLIVFVGRKFKKTF